MSRPLALLERTGTNVLVSLRALSEASDGQMKSASSDLHEMLKPEESLECLLRWEGSVR